MEDRQQILKKEVKRLREGAMVEIGKQKEKQGALREAEVQNGKLQEKLEYQEILMEEYK